MAKGPLAGVVVLDATRVLSGPHVGRVLRDLGADVVKVEPPDGDITRFAVPRVNSLAIYHVQQNAGKRNVSMDLQSEAGVEAFRRLADSVDVVLENFRPGVADRLGIGYEDLRARNPRLVYGAISGYGPGNAWSDRRAYARAVHAEMGLVLGDARDPQVKPRHTSFAHGDVYAAMELAIGVLAALRHREVTGEGQRVDVSMAQTLLYVNEFAAIDASGIEVDEERGPIGRGKDPIYATSDGQMVTIIANPVTEAGYRGYSIAMGDELTADPRFSTYDDRAAHEEELLDLLQAWVARFPSVEALQVALTKTPLASGLLRQPREVASSQWAEETDAYVSVDDRQGGAIRIPAAPWTFSVSPADRVGQAAYRGEHNKDVLRSLGGFEEVEVTELEQSGVLSARVPAPRT
jgi:crotonobetainyl-CoA:carnitine CoA-transferase CaiB-like acyl-CoA transferase